MMKAMTVAQVGCGYWGPNLLRVFNELEGSHVKWLCDLKPGRLDWARKRYPSLRLTHRYKELLADPEVDAVVVATEVVTHFALAREALKAGKHVFVEKPLAHTCAQAGTLARLAKKNGLTLGVGHVFLYHPAFRAVKAALTPGRIGKLRYVDLIRVNPGPPEPKHDVLWDMAPHDVALAIDLAGKPPREVRATGLRFSRSALDQAAFLELRFDGGIVGRIHVSWLSSRRVRRLEAYAERGCVFYDDLEPFEKVRVVSQGEDTRVGAKSRDAKSLYYGAGDITIPSLPPEEPLKTECADFLDCARRGRQPLSGPRMGVDVVRVLEAAARSAATGRPVALQ